MDETVAAPAAPEPVSAPETSPAPPEPISQSPRDSIDRAFAALETGEPIERSDRARNADGTFAAKLAETEPKPVEKAVEPKPAVSAIDAPKRFSDDAKAAWATAPEPVKSEITRAIKELEAGIAEHQARWEPLKPFEELAKQHKTTIPAALENYIGIERLIAQDPLKGLNQVCENMGLSLRQIAEHVLGKTPDQNAAAQEQVIADLRRELAGVKQQIGGVSSSIESQRQQAALAEITQFAADKPRFEELAGDITFLLESKRATSLDEAYKLAERLNPGPAPAAPAAAQPDPAQTRKGQLSLSGAPSSGSNPANRKPPSSPREALDRAFASVGF